MPNTSNSNEEANGFLVLDHCEVYLEKGGTDDSSKDFSSVDPWFDVEIPAPQPFSYNLPHHQTNRDVAGNDRLHTANSDDVNINHCPRSCLVLAKHSSFRETKELSVVGFEGYNGPRYDGTIRDTKFSGNQRSDAALMMGLALLSQDLGHIAIRSIKVGLYKIASQRDSLSPNTDKSTISRETSTHPKPPGNNNKYVYQKTKACLIITFWCRQMTTSLASPNQRRRFFQQVAKQLLPPVTQTIMSIMSSDWNDYDAKITELSLSWPVVEDKDIVDENESSSTDTNRIHRSRQRIPALSFFPSKMNLEDVFLRISGVSPSLLLSNPEFDPERRRKKDGIKCKSLNDVDENERINSERQSDSKKNTVNNTLTTTTFTTLPGDILCHSVGQYLRAKSLHSLRCTCKHLHWTLRAVVPGLKLRLYSHQIKSLMWMRGRESRHITEDDLLEGRRCRHRRKQSTSHGQNMTHWIKNTPDRDAHRAATGGGTVVLRPRRREVRNGTRYNDDTDADVDLDRNASPVRISQFDHSEIIEGRKFGNGSSVVGGQSDNYNPLARKVARGGLLCDDPGLGTY